MLEHILLVAQAAAREAGRLIRDNCGKTDVEKTKATEQDLVTVVDKACQDVIERAVTVAFPDHAILGEESVAAGSAASAEAIAAVFNHPWLWVVDPLDGTTMFVAGIPLSCTYSDVCYPTALMFAIIVYYYVQPYR
jgi:myo-inositol-1(or 4)-monophosphatase